MKLEYIKTKKLSDFAPIMQPLVKDFGYVFYSTVLTWCEILPERQQDYKYWEFRIIKLNNKTIGCCGLYSLNDNTKELWLSWFGIIPNLRNKGYGKKVLKYLEKEAKKVNCKTLMSYVDKEGNPLSFYEREGFKVIGTVKEFLIENKMRQIDGDEFEDMEDFVIRKKIK